jgi:putative flippase GtrA
VKLAALPAFVRFVLIGACAALVNVGARALLSRYFVFEAAVLGAFFIALSCAFAANRRWVFTQHRSASYAEFWRFLLVNLAALAQVWLISVGLVRIVFPALEFTWHAELIGHAIGVASPVITSYYAHKHYSFKTPAV